jgi:hypothetical protein
MAIADKFVANRKVLFIVALAPFVVISTLLLLLLPFTSLLYSIFVWSALLMHASC